MGRSRLARSSLSVALGLLLVGCADGHSPTTSASARAGTPALALDVASTRPPGLGARYVLPPFGALVRSARPVGRLRCSAPATDVYGAHVELFADDHELPVPPGIGWAPPQRRADAVVTAGRCAYPLRTDDPTGVIEIDAPALGDTPATVGELFRVWGQPLGPRRLADFGAGPGGQLVAYVDGTRWRADPGRIRLSRHAQVVLELGSHVKPHRTYLFPPGL